MKPKIQRSKGTGGIKGVGFDPPYPIYDTLSNTSLGLSCFQMFEGMVVYFFSRYARLVGDYVDDIFCREVGVLL